MSPAGLLHELGIARDLVTALAEGVDEESYRRQYHPDLSPLGWHLGHCTFIECFWLQEVILQDHRHTSPVTALYTPTLTPKPARGRQLPHPEALLHWVRDMQSLNLETLTSGTLPLHEHPLMQGDYLLHFLVQHYSQHYETMLMVLTQRALGEDCGDFRAAAFEARRPEPQRIHIQPGHYRVGGKPPGACDNELPAQQATLGPYSIARQPVSNSEYLAFMNDGGYSRQELWTADGWQWLQQSRVAAPEHWRRDAAGNWYGIGVRGAYELDGTDVLHGISRHEAAACANWAGGRLPHEHQWEMACRLHRLEQSGRAWEWCDNTFYPYEGFRPFPYDDYSQPWFDNNHYVLRGGSLYTRPAVRHSSFRNFYQPDKRHVFAGLRLVY